MLKILLQIIEGVQSLHSAGVLHCDLSHNNVIIDEKNRVKIIDLGISQNYTERTITQQITGVSYLYMDDAYINRSQTSEKTDVYSIGALAFVLMTGGSRPWNALLSAQG